VDTDLLKTFLEVSRTRHFGRAAENLFLTQSAVSARIRQLEDAIGAGLFTRTRNDIQLTPAGARFVKYAESILATWNRARQDAVLKAENKESLAIGGMFSLWDVVLQNWLHQVHAENPDLALIAEAGAQDVLVRKLLDGSLDLAFMWEPPQMAELDLVEVGTIRLILVSSRSRMTAAQALSDHYIRVDWGTSFALSHARIFPDMPVPGLRVGLGRMALAMLQSVGGSAYLAEPMVRDLIESGKLHPVTDAPEIDRAFHAVYPHSIVERRPLIRDLIERARRSSGENRLRVVARRS